MPKPVVIIVVIVVVIAHVIGSLLERSTKAKQEARLRQMGARRAGPTGGAPVAQDPVSLGDRARELAARRRAQLEELRQRRTQRQTPSSQGGVIARTGGSPPTAPQTRPTRFQPPAPPQRPVLRRRPPAPVSVARMPQPPRTAVEPPPGRPITPRQEIPATRRSEANPYALRTKAIEPLLGVRGSRIELLRKMIVLKEILDPPVALREQQGWERG